PPAWVVPNRLPLPSNTGLAHGPVPSGPPPVNAYSTLRFHAPPAGDNSYMAPKLDNPPANSAPYRLPDASSVTPPSSSPPSSDVNSWSLLKAHLPWPKGLNSKTTPVRSTPPNIVVP